LAENPGPGLPWLCGLDDRSTAHDMASDGRDQGGQGCYQLADAGYRLGHFTSTCDNLVEDLSHTGDIAKRNHDFVSLALGALFDMGDNDLFHPLE
jgi:hypothetical protein